MERLLLDVHIARDGGAVELQGASTTKPAEHASGRTETATVDRAGQGDFQVDRLNGGHAVGAARDDQVGIGYRRGRWSSRTAAACRKRKRERHGRQGSQRCSKAIHE